MADSVVSAIVGGAVTLLVSVMGFIISLIQIKKNTNEKIEALNKETRDAVDKETTAIKLGVQAMLRAQMISDYNKYTEKGYAPIYARENFENMWIHYETLGANGVIHDIHDKFLELPTKNPQEV